jgi:hypothetical protein
MAYYIDNYRPQGTELSSAEFIKKRAAPLDITKTHGLGSGLYGLVHGTQTARAGVEILTTGEIMNPVVLNTDEKTAWFETFTRHFNYIIEGYINKTASGAEVTAAIDALIPQIKPQFLELFYRLDGVTLEGGIRTHLLRTIQSFSQSYSRANVGDFLWQPINYLLMPVYGGIYNSSHAGNTLDRGSVAFQAINPRHQKQAFNIEGAFVPAGRRLIAIGGRRRSGRKTRKGLTLGTKRANRKYITK